MIAPAPPVLASAIDAGWPLQGEELRHAEWGPPVLVAHALSASAVARWVASA